MSTPADFFDRVFLTIHARKIPIALAFLVSFCTAMRGCFVCVITVAKSFLKADGSLSIDIIEAEDFADTNAYGAVIFLGLNPV